jgi:hypothetical protein
MSNETPRSGEELDSESIGHRALAKIEFACKVKLPDARIACRDICWGEKTEEINHGGHRGHGGNIKSLSSLRVTPCSPWLNS